PMPGKNGSQSGPNGPGTEPNHQDLTLPGILHFIQHEWARFEAEKSRWEAEKAELQAQVTFLQGERKGQESLKQDLVRRIKMLEYALKQERAKYHKFKFGTDGNQGDKKGEASDSVSNGPVEGPSEPNSQLPWKDGRQLLRQLCFKEFPMYVLNISEISLGCVSTLPLDAHIFCHSGEQFNKKNPVPPPPQQYSGAGAVWSTVLELFAGPELALQLWFLKGGEFPFGPRCRRSLVAERWGRSNPEHRSRTVRLPSKPLVPEVDDDDDDDSEDALNEFDFLGSGEEGEGGVEVRSSGDGKELENRRSKLQDMLSDFRDVDGLPAQPSVSSAATGQPRSHDVGSLGFSSEVFIMDTIGGGAVSLGELADLTVTNDNDISFDAQDARDAFKKTWNPKFTLRSHFDGIRALAFHHSEPVLLTASEDCTLKLWNLQKTVTAKKNAALDVEPIYAFRAHRGAVLALVMGSNGENCYSGGVDGTVRCWKIPDFNMDPYDNYADPGILCSVLNGHTDAVWGLAFSSCQNRLASCSADGTVRIWDTTSHPSCVSIYNKDNEGRIPSSVAFGSAEPAHVVASYSSGDTVIYDLHTSQPIITLESKVANGSSHINRVVSHPSQPITITAHDDRGIRFLDNRTGKVIHSMVAHLDAVTCLAVDPNGVYLMSGSHDCSIRLWNLENRTCVQEITAHRKKHDEAIHDVVFHPSKPFIASAGADALAKVFI
uniref:Striatin 4 n=1 Tax=Latimeria chalumnae TaxID=7897 RepID=H2ZZ06_LATCH